MRRNGFDIENEKMAFIKGDKNEKISIFSFCRSFNFRS